MNDEQVIERVRTAVNAQVAGVQPTPPQLGEPSYAAGTAPRRARWLLPAALAAVAAIALGVVIVSRGDDAANVDVPSSSVDGVGGIERWILDLPGSMLVGKSESDAETNWAGTSVYYVAEDGAQGAVARTNGSSIQLTRSSWPDLSDVNVLGVTATRYRDDDQELLVVPTDPPLIVETYGGWSSAELAAGAALVDGVWTLPATEVGRQREGELLHYSQLSYAYEDELINLIVWQLPGGLVASLLDGGRAPGEVRLDERGQRWYINGTSATNDAPTGDVVTIVLDEGSPLAIPGAGSTAMQVDEATWQSLVVTSETPDTTLASSPLEQYTAVGTVIEVPGEGVKLCLGAVRESLPPQCDGIPVDPVTWRWPEGTFQEANGTRWGEYVVNGVYDGTMFTPKTDARLATSSDGRYLVKGSTATRCAEPEGGWHAAAENTPLGPGESALAPVQAYLESQADYGGMWIDDSITLPTDREARYVVNAMFTGDVERHRAELEAIWPGALCVVETTTKPVRELVTIQHEVMQMSGSLTSLIDDPNGTVIATFVLVTPELQADLDARYGAGTVVLTSALEPV